MEHETGDYFDLRYVERLILLGSWDKADHYMSDFMRPGVELFYGAPDGEKQLDNYLNLCSGDISAWKTPKVIRRKTAEAIKKWALQNPVLKNKLRMLPSAPKLAVVIALGLKEYRRRHRKSAGHIQASRLARHFLQKRSHPSHQTPNPSDSLSIPSHATASQSRITPTKVAPLSMPCPAKHSGLAVVIALGLKEYRRRHRKSAGHIQASRLARLFLQKRSHPSHQTPNPSDSLSIPSHDTASQSRITPTKVAPLNMPCPAKHSGFSWLATDAGFTGIKKHLSELDQGSFDPEFDLSWPTFDCSLQAAARPRLLRPEEHISICAELSSNSVACKGFAAKKKHFSELDQDFLDLEFDFSLPTLMKFGDYSQQAVVSRLLHPEEHITLWAELSSNSGLTGIKKHFSELDQVFFDREFDLSWPSFEESDDYYVHALQNPMKASVVDDFMECSSSLLDFGQKVCNLFCTSSGQSLLVVTTTAFPKTYNACFQLTNDNSCIVMAHEQGIRVFDLLNGKVKSSLAATTSRAACMTINPVNNNIIIGYMNSFIVVYDEDMNVFTSLLSHEGKITSLALSGMLNVLLSSGADCKLVKWNMDCWSESASVKLPKGKIAPSICIGTQLQMHCNQIDLLVLHDNQLAVYDASTLRCVSEWSPDYHSTITYATYSCDGNVVYASFLDGTVAILNTQDKLDLRMLIKPTSYLSEEISSGAHPVVIAAHPLTPNHLSLGLEDGRVVVLKLHASNMAPPRNLLGLS